jgi:DMSO/TMAO reductase YedYZ molybdopterin-dependent catalytic subunit
MNDRLIGRAGFLGIVGAGAAGLFFARDLGRAVSRITPDSVGSIVPTSGWRIYTIGNSIPAFDPATYRLKITGLVERELTYTLAELRAMKAADQVSDFHCVTGWSVDDVHWRGVRFETLLAEAKPRPGASWLRFLSAEPGYHDTLSFEQVALPNVMLAYEMDGKPLSSPHGAPTRVVIPQMYGYKYVKWVQEIEVTDRFEEGFWEQHGYDSDAWVGGSNGISA